MSARLCPPLRTVVRAFAAALRRPGGRATGVLAIAFALSAVGTFSAPSSAFGWSQGSFSSADEAKLVALTNQARASAGLKPLLVDSTLTLIARWRSKDMIVRDYFDHAIPNPPGGTVFTEMKRRGYCSNSAGENIGENLGYADSTATKAIQALFMSSPGHKANILGKSYDHIGIGAYKGPGNKKMWTVIFADKCGSSSAPAPKPKPAPKATPRPTVHTSSRPTHRPKPVAVTATPTPAPTADPYLDPSLLIASGGGGSGGSHGVGVLDSAGIHGLQGLWVVVRTGASQVAWLQLPWATPGIVAMYGAAEALLGPY